MGDPEEVPRTTRFLLPVLADLPGHLVWRAHARVVWLLKDTLPPTTDIHGYAVLLALADGRARSQQDLAETVSVSRTTLTRVAADLVADGLVERVRNPRDRRSYALTRTAAGARRAVAWAADASLAEAAVEACFTPGEADRLRGLLKRLLRDQLAADIPAELDASIGFLLTRLHFRLHRDFVAALAPLDLEPRHYGSLTALASLGPVPQRELAATLGLSGPTVVQIADDLEARGLLQRRRSPADRRTQLLHLLPAATTALTHADVIERQVAGARLAPLDREEQHDLAALLRRFITQDGPS